MATKLEIIQNLLDAHQITAEQAVVLLTPDAKEVQYVFVERPHDNFWPSVPWPQPIVPTWITSVEN